MTAVMLSSPEKTQQAGSEFAGSLEPGSVVGLIGPLGAGKTTFIQGMAQGLGIDPEAYVTSPTFAIIHEYETAGAASSAPTLYHFDLYRLRSFDELIGVGLEDYIHRGGICVIEWADRFEELGSLLTHRVTISIEDENARRIEIGAL